MGTSTPAFLGYTVRGPQKSTPPVRVGSWSEFVDTFHFRSPMGAEGVGRELARLPGAIAEGTAELERLGTDLAEKATTGESPVLTEQEITVLALVQAADWAGEAVAEEDRKAAEAAAKKVVEALPGPYGLWVAAGNDVAGLERREGELTVIAGYFVESGRYQLPEVVYGFFANGGTACYVLRLDPDQPLSDEVDGHPDARTGLAGLKTVPDVTMVAVPDVWHEETPAEVRPVIMRKVVGHCATMRNRLALLEPPPDTTPAEVPAFLEKLDGPDEDAAAFTALYYPWVTVPGVDGTPRTVVPSGHLAGVWARTDAERGVFKAPANQSLRGVLSLPTPLTDQRHGELNEKGVNCLRVFPGRGLLVWGARTRSSSRDWRYLNVRRLVSFLSDSIRQSSTWAVFEPNDDRLWGTLRHAVSSFLTDQWRQGALLGRTPDEAFYVICDRTNNTSATIDAGQVICDIGIAPVRPAEFVQFTITQIAGQPGTDN
ncbi:phage tail sheath subtilisin-like domain-containing protein [Streptomyces sp. NBC_01456]|uniref:phage tail sheath family protein n=1 Tax=unclassified Streptomyces TaxID=2593676 RepID=UPI002E2ED10C|nr:MULTISPECIES: phage tail sheath C-terminal domain-containing protein [unclassified Streptomyces]